MTNVRWTYDDSRLISTGGADTAVLVWSHGEPKASTAAGGESDDSDTDSEEEGGTNTPDLNLSQTRVNPLMLTLPSYNGALMPLSICLVLSKNSKSF